MEQENIVFVPNEKQKLKKELIMYYTITGLMVQISIWMTYQMLEKFLWRHMEGHRVNNLDTHTQCNKLTLGCEYTLNSL